MKQITISEDGSIQIVGKWKTGELFTVAEEVRRVALGVEIDFKPASQQPPNAAKENEGKYDR